MVLNAILYRESGKIFMHTYNRYQMFKIRVKVYLYDVNGKSILILRRELLYCLGYGNKNTGMLLSYDRSLLHTSPLL